MAAEAVGELESDLGLRLARLVRDDLNVALRVGKLVVCGRVQNPLLDRLDGGDQLHRSTPDLTHIKFVIRDPKEEDKNLPFARFKERLLEFHS